jgi:hypothetical protein
MSGLVRGGLEEALSQALDSRALPADPNVVEELVGAVHDWLDGLGDDDQVARLTSSVRDLPWGHHEGIALSPWWSCRTLQGLALMLRRRL